MNSYITKQTLLFDFPIYNIQFFYENFLMILSYSSVHILKILQNLNVSLIHSFKDLFPKEKNKIKNLIFLKGKFGKNINIKECKTFNILLSNDNNIIIIALILNLKNQIFSYKKLMSFFPSDHLIQIIELSFCDFNFFLSSTKNKKLILYKKDYNKYFLIYQTIKNITQYNIDFIQEINQSLIITFCYFESIFSFWEINNYKIINEGNLLLDLSPYTKKVYVFRNFILAGCVDFIYVIDIKNKTIVNKINIGEDWHLINYLQLNNNKILFGKIKETNEGLLISTLQKYSYHNSKFLKLRKQKLLVEEKLTGIIKFIKTNKKGKKINYLITSFENGLMKIIRIKNFN